MTHQDLTVLAKEDSLVDYEEASINSAIHQIGYEAGFKKALELVLKGVSNTNYPLNWVQVFTKELL